MARKNIALTCLCFDRPKLKKTKKSYMCTNSNCIHSHKGNEFKILNGLPVIISETLTDTVCSADQIETYVKRTNRNWSSLIDLLSSTSKITRKNCDTFVKRLFSLSDRPKVLVIGGAKPGSGTEKLWGAANIDIHSVDIYSSEYVDVICDGHYLPFSSKSYDGVWIQAVLEHVVEPGVVVKEIHRVLKDGGVVYAETPFMQQVHEGAYDFTRYTVLGHRYLFKEFEVISMGGNMGAATVVVWSLKYLVWALFRSKLVARLTGVLLGILLRPLDMLVSERSMHDAASGVFFMGTKSTDNVLSHKDLVKLYDGNFK